MVFNKFVIFIFLLFLSYLSIKNLKLNEKFYATNEDDLLNKLYLKVTELEYQLDQYKKNEYSNVSEELNDMRNKYDGAYKWYKSQNEINQEKSNDIVANLKM